MGLAMEETAIQRHAPAEARRKYHDREGREAEAKEWVAFLDEFDRRFRRPARLPDIRLHLANNMLAAAAVCPIDT